MWLRILWPKTAWIITRFWKPVRYWTSWLNLIIPFIEQIDQQSLATQTKGLFIEWITKDAVQCKTNVNVVYKVTEDASAVRKSLYSISDFTEVLLANVEEQVRAIMVKFKHNDIFSKKTEIWDAVKIVLKEALWEYWYEIESVQVKWIELDPKVMSAMNWVIAAAREKEASIIDAQAQAEVKRLEGEWMAKQRQEIANWFKESVDEFKKIDNTLTWSKVLNKLIEMSSIDMQEKIWTSKNSKIIFMNWHTEHKDAVLTGELIKEPSSDKNNNPFKKK